MSDWKIADLPDEIRPHVRIDLVSGCWIWTGWTNKAGYGFIGPRRVHRVVYEHLVKPIPSGLDLDHVQAWGCTSKSCCWPGHLEPVTRAENTRRIPRHRPPAEINGIPTISAGAARTKWTEAIDRVFIRRGHIYVLRYRKPVAVMVPVDWYERVIAEQKEGKAA